MPNALSATSPMLAAIAAVKEASLLTVLQIVPSVTAVPIESNPPPTGASHRRKSKTNASSHRPSLPGYMATQHRQAVAGQCQDLKRGGGVLGDGGTGGGALGNTTYCRGGGRSGGAGDKGGSGGDGGRRVHRFAANEVFLQTPSSWLNTHCAEASSDSS